ncbi:TRAP transporter large permease [Cereibacter sphaeroides]|nr:TRAP transporter large permease [Cereibacter sphaeroides]
MIGPVLLILLLLAIGFAASLHVGTTLGLTALIAGLIYIGPVWDFFGQIPWTTNSSVTMTVVPLFVLMGELLLRSGLTDDLYAALSRLVGRLPGGLLHSNILASGVFAAVSGSSLATATTIGAVALPTMKQHGYNERITLGSIAAGGTLGILIPPSLIMIVYGLVAQVSIGDLYVAGIVPGLLMMVGFIGAILVLSLFGEKGERTITRYSLREKLAGLVNIIPIALLIGLVIGTIYLGVATATEAAAYGATGALVIAIVKRRLNWPMLKEALISTAMTTGMILFVVNAAFLLQFVLSFIGVPRALSHSILSLGLSSMELILVICVIFILLGMVMDGLPIVVAVVPIFLPLLQAQGIDLVWFGILVVILIELGLITPPVGMNLFVLQGVRHRLYGDAAGKMTDIVIGVLPFIVAMLVVLGLVIAFPQIAMGLVGAMR